MSANDGVVRNTEVWAQFRLSVIGKLLSAQLESGELSAELARLAETWWKHPVTGLPTRYGRSTIERWYYDAKRGESDLVSALKRKVRSDAGSQPSVHAAVIAAIRAQYQEHPNWTYKLHMDNLEALACEDAALRPLPSYETLVRFMKAQGMYRRKRPGPVGSPGGALAQERFAQREVRSYESQCVNALWHSDYHCGSLAILMPDGERVYPKMLGILDDCSRLCCHAQWYLDETAHELVHGLCQGFAKRGLPMAVLWDNGAAMTALETKSGMQRLGVQADYTLPYSPYQNGKQESFWGQVEGRLLPMLESMRTLTLAILNEATQAWLELEYNRKEHSELGMRPVDRYVQAKDVSRPCPESATLRQAFTREVARTQRRSDGTITIKGVRFEIPSRYGHLQTLHVRYATWDLSHVWLCNARNGDVLCKIYPLDKAANSDGVRRRRDPAATANLTTNTEPQDAPAPLLRKLIADYAATGLPPAYLLMPTQTKEERE